MATNQYSLLRQWHMLGMVRRARHRISASEPCERLCAAGFEMAKRTVERDLPELSTVFPIAVDDDAGPTHGRRMPAYRPPGPDARRQPTTAQARFAP